MAAPSLDMDPLALRTILAPINSTLLAAALVVAAATYVGLDSAGRRALLAAVVESVTRPKGGRK